MPNLLKKIIKREIIEQGPIGIDRYMELCLSHPEHGYYMQRQPFGKTGDFITSPEISQMFGELVGLWLVHMWHELGSPTPFALVELGPGRGTLMADVLRAARVQPSFLNAAQIYLYESSEQLKSKQRKILGDGITHLKSLQEIPNIPLLIFANEFFDALPVKQFVKNDFGWQERKLDIELKIVLSKTVENASLDTRFVGVETGRIVEINQLAEEYSNEITKMISDNTGVALFIDYGDFDGVGDTLQAVQNHKKVDPLRDPGNADLTSHVRFCDLVQNDVNFAFTTQGQFLKQLGIEARKNALETQSGKDMASEQNRLVDDDAMGSIFKVLSLASCDLAQAPGFLQ